MLTIVSRTTTYVVVTYITLYACQVPGSELWPSIELVLVHRQVLAHAILHVIELDEPCTYLRMYIFTKNRFVNAISRHKRMKCMPFG